MNKRKTIVTAAAALATLTLSTLAFRSGIFQEVRYNIKFGPNDAQMQYPIYESEDRVYVSVRDMCDNLGIPIEWDEENREINVDMYNKQAPVSDETEYKEEGVIPDEETALAVGKTILEKYIGEPVEYETEDRIYYLDVIYVERENVWNVSQEMKYKDGRVWFVGGLGIETRRVCLNKNNGEVVYISTESYLDDMD